MGVSPSDFEILRTIVGNASTLPERISPAIVATDTGDDSQANVELLHHWSETVLGTDMATLEQRLGWDGLTLEAVQQACGPAALQADQPLPDWAQTLHRIITSGVALAQPSNRIHEAVAAAASLNAADPLPFEALYLPCLHVARQKLAARLAQITHRVSVQNCRENSGPEEDPADLMSSAARTGLERSLLIQLTDIAARTFLKEFTVFRSARGSFLDRLTGPSPGSDSLYGAFVQEQLQDGLISIFQRYSVLGRLMARSVDTWVQATCELLERFAADRVAIATHLNGGVKLGQIVMLHAGLSDRHRGGRTVVALGFDHGIKLIYKPKNMQLEAAFGQFQRWCNRHDVPLPLRAVNVLDRGTHGWVEFIEPSPCQTEEEVAEFYTRAGILQAMLHVLEGVDCHRENLIASGSHPVLIDMEALLTPQEREDAVTTSSAPYMLARELNDSVIRCGLLPCWERTMGGQYAVDLSGLSSAHDQTGRQRTPAWQHINTDAMTLVYEERLLVPYPNAPSLRGQPVALNDYLDELLDGFSKMVHFFIRHRAVLLDPAGPLESLYRSPVRFIFRATAGYGTMLHNNLRPECLEDGARWSTAFDTLYRPFLDADSQVEPEWFAPFVRAECASIENLDVPYFEVRADTVDLMTPLGELIRSCFHASGGERVRTRLQSLSVAELEQQAQIIRHSVLARTVHVAQTDDVRSETHITLPTRSLTQTQLLDAAQAIGDELSEHVFRGTDSSATWLGFTYYHEAGRYQLSPVWMTLYDGSSGIALFLAALARCTQQTHFADLALAALQPLRELVRQTADRRTNRRIPTVGEAGGMLYALVKVAEFLEQPHLLDDAHRLATLITPEWITADKSYDVLLGSAGALLGLLALHASDTQRPQNDTPMDRARWCGEHLLKQQRVQNVGGAAWRNENPRPLTGFSHGAAGIAYALQRLYSTTRDGDVLAAAQQAIIYEQSVFNPDFVNWPDFRMAPPQFRRSWCHGAPGIGLARLGGLEVLDESPLRHDIEVALQTTLTTKVGQGDADHVCCGGFGLVDILLSAAQILDRSDLRSAAHDRTHKLLQTAERSGGFCLFPRVPYQVFQPAFFQGSSGIGYSLLRLADPALPSVLLWQ